MSDTHIGKKIRAIRRLRGLTQDELAKKINKTRALVSHIEQTGKSHPYTLHAIAQALNINEEILETFNENIQIVQEPSVPYGKNEMEKLKDKIKNLESENKMQKDLIESQKKIILMLEKEKKK